MARGRKSHTSDEENAKTRKGGLKPAYGACGDNRYVIYCDLKRESDEYARILVRNCKAEYAAKYLLDKLVGNDTYEECDPLGGRTGVITSSGVRIMMYGDELDGLLNYEPTDEEKGWRDEQVDRAVAQFKFGRHDGSRSVDNGSVDERDDDLPKYAPAARAARAERTKADREPKIRVPKADTTGHVSANDIAKRLGVEGRDVRGVLRTLKLEKPAHGWSWPKKEAEGIEAQIVKGLKDAKKGKKK